MPNRKSVPIFSRYLYRSRSRVERFFNKLKHFRALATRYDKRADNFLAPSNSRQSGSGCALMSLWPNATSYTA
jgi:transposase